MAPRGWPKKKNTRMDAALEAMKSYGFSNDLILKKIKELLTVYGDENWFFIEENSYRVLLDSILDNVEQEEHRRDVALDGPSSGVLALPSSDAKALDNALPTSEFLKLAPQTYEALDTSLLTHISDNDDHLLLPGEGAGQKDLNSGQNARKERNTYAIEAANENCSVVGSVRTANLSSPHAIHPEKPMDSIPILSRRPFYGWISSEDEVNEEDFVKLEPTPLPDELAKLLFGTNVYRRRRTRWDLKPEDM